MNTLKMIDEKISLILNLTLAAAGAVIVLVLWPMVNQLQALDRQQSLLSKDNIMVNSLIKSQGKNNAPLITLGDAPRVMQEIVDLGNTHAITFLSVVNHDKSKISYKKINTLAIDLEIEAPYKQLSLFMGELNDLERGIIVIDSFQMKQETQDTDRVKAKMVLYICLKSSSPPHKAGKNATASHQEALSFIKDYSSNQGPEKNLLDWANRDPFEAEAVVKKISDVPKAKIKDKPAFVYDLNGIFWNEVKPSAIINGLVVETGSPIGPSTVKEIGPNEVVLFDGTKNIILDLRETERT